ncbi:response regulator transcription factor [Heyndrickxia sporothermodurans]
MFQSSILLVDDERSLLKLLKTILIKDGFQNIHLAASAEEALSICKNQKVDLVLLDIMLPGKSGFDICPILQTFTNAPILFLSARTSDSDILTGFALGGDDYISKPFNPMEVVARVKARLRREEKVKQHPVFRFERFEIDESKGELRVLGKPVSCPKQVYQLLLFFCKHQNQLFTKQQLFEKVWGYYENFDDNTVMVHIRRVREKIEEDPSRPNYLLTVRGLGYKLVDYTTTENA